MPLRDLQTIGAIRTVDAASVNVALCNSFAVNMDKLDSLVQGAVGRNLQIADPGIKKIGFWTPRPAHPRLDRLASPRLSQAQRGWLAKGIRSWNSQVDAAARPVMAGLCSKPSGNFFDLNTFLYRRYLASAKKRSRWQGGRRKSETLRAWFSRFHYVVLPRLSSGLRPTALSRELLAVLGAPPGWTAAAPFRVVLEALIPRILARLATVIAPNAPSRPSRHLALGGTAL